MSVLSVINFFPFYVLILSILIGFCIHKIYKFYENRQTKFHWHLMIFHNVETAKYFKVFLRLKKRNITLYNILYVKEKNKLDDNFLLLAVSYLGHMTTMEFGDMNMIEAACSNHSDVNG
jgi:hypothetical protein